MHQERNVHMARCCFGTKRQVWLFLAENVQRIESPMALWLGTVIEKGQLAYSRSGCELTGEIWSWILPEGKGVLGEISFSWGWPTTHSTIRDLKHTDGWNHPATFELSSPFPNDMSGVLSSAIVCANKGDLKPLAEIEAVMVLFAGKNNKSQHIRCKEAQACSKNNIFQA